MPSGILVTDADNTLWDTNSVFARAQLSILGHIEDATQKSITLPDRLAFIRRIDQEIARTHESGLKYPPSLLVEALATALDVRPLNAKQVNEALETYYSSLAIKPRLRNGVRATLGWLRKSDVDVLVASEGHRNHVLGNIDAHGFGDLIAEVVSARKTATLYKDLFSRGEEGLPRACVGDQLDKDIAPSKAAGFETFYFPGGFRPSWEFDLGAPSADHIIKDYSGIKQAFSNV